MLWKQWTAIGLRIWMNYYTCITLFDLDVIAYSYPNLSVDLANLC